MTKLNVSVVEHLRPFPVIEIKPFHLSLKIPVVFSLLSMFLGTVLLISAAFCLFPNAIPAIVGIILFSLGFLILYIKTGLKCLIPSLRKKEIVVEKVFIPETSKEILLELKKVKAEKEEALRCNDNLLKTNQEMLQELQSLQDKCRCEYFERRCKELEKTSDKLRTACIQLIGEVEKFLEEKVVTFCSDKAALTSEKEETKL
ncbi:hypothetical protein [Chlamydia sp. 17-3921]|uniref:hypothetical protein n=1 Tax=Chlamydia sp. 17-3921 TaxID=2675798 RepID=UPI0019182BDA|nr:hypothetical protein [Chlamydia sp. 17-3921]